MGEEYIAAAIHSALDQTYERVEIIIVDDCSSDRTADIALGFPDKRVKYYRNDKNLGPEGNWNRCLDLAEGKYYKLLPHDDLLSPNCIKSQVEIFEADQNKTIALVFGGKTIINSHGKKMLTRLPFGRTPSRVSSKDLVNKCIRSGSNIIGEPGNGLIRAELIDEIGRYNQTFPYVIDLDYWFRVLLHGDAYYTGEVASCFRISEQAWSTKIGKEQHSDYFGMVEKYANDPRYEITAFSRIFGMVNSYIISFLRRMLYLLMRFSRALTTRPKDT